MESPPHTSPPPAFIQVHAIRVAVTNEPPTSFWRNDHLFSGVNQERKVRCEIWVRGWVGVEGGVPVGPCFRKVAWGTFLGSFPLNLDFNVFAGFGYLTGWRSIPGVGLLLLCVSAEPINPLVARLLDRSHTAGAPCDHSDGQWQACVVVWEAGGFLAAGRFEEQACFFSGTHASHAIRVCTNTHARKHTHAHNSPTFSPPFFSICRSRICRIVSYV